ncbi:hypothetical protein NC653_012844 [Populus alba x Populus x berolinensis]|uniref:Uncharacterized protein n=1 Tax=Populus alba x Populus x berolinensis TaxID=444605 RepID=A0AAD6QSX7_9ROSI|nr:hypothetical protein NC653_012844 [Populus alba x Populus x berolinensis]
MCALTILFVWKLIAARDEGKNIRRNTININHSYP